MKYELHGFMSKVSDLNLSMLYSNQINELN